MPGRKRGRQVRDRDGEVRAHESAADSLLPVLIRNGDQFGAGAVCRGVDGPRDRSEPIARNFPLIRRASRIGFGRSFETGIVVCHDGQIPIRKKYTALGFFELPGDLFPLIRKSVRGTPNQNMRPARGTCVRGDDQRQREPRRAVRGASCKIRGRGIFCSGGILRHDDLAGDCIGKTIAIGIHEHPSRRKGIAQMILRREHGRCDLRLCERVRAVRDEKYKV